MKKHHGNTLAIGLCCLISACATTTPVTTTTPAKSATHATNAEHMSFKPDGDQLFADLQGWLPGYYSNYTQVIEAGGSEDSVTDLNIRKLPTLDETVFLFESQQRDAIEANYDLYFARLNTQSNIPELHFARMTGSDLTSSLPETLDIGWQRAMPGCVLSLAPIYLQSLTERTTSLLGSSNYKTCQFEDPIHGRTALKRSLSMSSHDIQIIEVELKPGEEPAKTAEEMPQAMLFTKHQAFEGTVSLKLPSLSESSESTHWHHSSTINFYDDGRVSHLYDTEMQPMAYAIRLSKMHWRENEPAYFRLEAIHLETGAAQAYSWFRPDSEQIDWEMDWLEVHLKELDLEQQ